jgi:hypothetical protein
MDVIISVIAVVAATSCFAAIVTAELKDKKKRRAAEGKFQKLNKNR